MAWIELDDGIWDHYKTSRLCSLLGLSDVVVVGHLVSLWHFALRTAWRDASLELWGDDGIERGARWGGERGRFVAALRESGFMDGYVMHGWMERAGRLITDRLRKEAQRQETARRLSESCRGKSAPCPGKSAPCRGKSGLPNQPNQPNPTNPTQPEGAGVEFEKFWGEYPKQGRSNKAKAEDMWIKLQPPIDKVISALAWQKTQARWTKDNGAYVPLAANWLKDARWEDENPATGKPGPVYRILSPEESR